MKDLKIIFFTFALIFASISWFYLFESRDAYKLRRAVYQALNDKNKPVFLKDIFVEDWDMVCPVPEETIYPKDIYRFSKYMKSEYSQQVPDTFAYNYSFGFIFLLEKKPVKIINIKDYGFAFKDVSYHLSAKSDIECYTRADAKISFKENIPPYHRYEIFITGEIQ